MVNGPTDKARGDVSGLRPPNERTLHFKGLTPAEVEASRAKHGANVITPPTKEPWWKLYGEKFDDPVIRILMIAAIIALTVGIFEGKYAEGVGILVAIFLATFLAFYNEFKAQKEFDLLDRASDEDLIKVIRNGNPTQVPKRDLVVGDMVFLEKGEEPPADGRVMEAVSLQVNEAPLTGESDPVDKVTTGEVDPNAAAEASYPLDMIYRGAEVVEGRGIIELTAVGDATKIGKIAATVGKKSEVETPLNKQLKHLSDLIGVLAFFIAGLLFAALIGRGILTGELSLTPQQWGFTAILFVSVSVVLARVWLPLVSHGLGLAGREAKPPAWMGPEDKNEDEDENRSEEGEGDGRVSPGELRRWLKSLAVAVAIFAMGCAIGYVTGFIPQSPSEWLPKVAGEEFLKYFMIAVTLIVVAVPEGLAMSVTLSLAYSMRKLMADNNLVRRLHACETIGAATVICTDKTGTLTMNEMRVHEVAFPVLDGRTRLGLAGTLHDYERLIVEAISANTTGNLDRTATGPSCAVGNRTECALLLWLDSQGVDYLPHRLDFQIIRQLPFDNKRKYMGTWGISPAKYGRILYVKGAPEIVLDHCEKVLTSEGVQPLDEFRASIEAALHDYEGRGMRCLALAYCDAPEEGYLTPEQLTRQMTWLGFVAIEDPVREEVPAAIQACFNAGIDVKIITGDNPRTAIEIARQIGLWADSDGIDGCCIGHNFRSLSDREVKEIAPRLKVLARAEPEDKKRFVELLQKDGHVVAVTGDGVNDVGALHQAQVGLAMGIRGTDATKKASDIVIKDDSFTSVATGVMWGRSLYQNIQRFILFQLTINVVACSIALLGPFIGVKLPLTVTQMLWINLIMDTFAALGLAAEPPHREVMQRPPRDSHEFIVTRPMAQNIFSVGFTFLIFLVGFLFYIQQDGRVTENELSAFFTTFVMLQFWNLFNARCLGLNQSAFSGLGGNPWFVIIAIAIFTGQVLIIQFGGDVFRTVPLSLRDWMVIVAGTSVVLWIGELWRLGLRLQAQGLSH